jgi:threonine/homoserine/homoserine lactone efflux protein
LKATTTATLFLPPGTSPWLAGLVIFTVCSLVNFSSASIWTTFGVGIGRLLTSQSRLLAFNVTMSVLLVGTAVIVLL